MEPADEIKKLFEKAKITAGPETDSRIIGDALNVLKNRSVTRQQNIWRIIMNNKITKFAAAAVIVAAVIAGISFIGDTSSVALADVLENVMKINSYSFRVKTTASDVSDYTEYHIMISKDYGRVMTLYAPDEADGKHKLFMKHYTDVSKGVVTAVIERYKSYRIVDIADEAKNKLKEYVGNPDFILREFVKQPYVELGRDNIDGVDVIGFESTDIADKKGRSVAKLWIDVKTELPVLIETETFSEDDVFISKTVIHDFDWNVQFTKSDFQPIIPDDYKKLDIDEDEFSADETNIIAALKFYAKIFDGKYPETLAVKALTLSNKVKAAIRSGVGKENFAGRSEQEIMKEVIQGFTNLAFTASAYSRLASENKAVAYYGDKVTADNPDAVLMRWRTDDGRYMVIFGDLTTKEVTEEALAELEAMPLIKNSK